MVYFLAGSQSPGISLGIRISVARFGENSPGDGTGAAPSPTANLWLIARALPEIETNLLTIVEVRPACSTAEMWTKTSAPPFSGRMKPKPFWGLNHLTVPTAMNVLQVKIR
jgi:hypothetical protein